MELFFLLSFVDFFFLAQTELPVTRSLISTTIWHEIMAREVLTQSMTDDNILGIVYVAGKVRQRIEM